MPPVPFRRSHLSLLFAAVVLASALLTQALPPLTGTGARSLAILITVAGALALGAAILAMARKRRGGDGTVATAHRWRRSGAGRATAWSVRADVPGHDRASFSLRPAGDRPPPPEPHEPEDLEPHDRERDVDPADDWSGQRMQPEAGVDGADPTAPTVDAPAPAASQSEPFVLEPVASEPPPPPPFAPAPVASEPPPPGPPPTGTVEPPAPARVPSPPDKPWWNEDPDDFRAELLADAGRSVEHTPPPAPPSDRSDGR
jgi:hypothetical protein